MLVFRALVIHYTSCSKPFWWISLCTWPAIINHNDGSSDLLLAAFNKIVYVSIIATFAIPVIVGYFSGCKALTIASTKHQPSVLDDFAITHQVDPWIAMTDSVEIMDKPLTMNHYSTYQASYSTTFSFFWCTSWTFCFTPVSSRYTIIGNHFTAINVNPWWQFTYCTPMLKRFVPFLNIIDWTYLTSQFTFILYI